jgi:carboxyl-terminal processing protease
MKKINFNKFVKKISNSKFFKTEFNFLEICLVMVMTLFIGFTVGNIVFANMDFDDEAGIVATSDSLSDELSNVEKVYKLITDTYYGDVSNEEIIDGAISGMMNAVGDDYSLYYDEEENEQFELLLTGSFVGMGSQIGRDEDGNVVFTNVFEGSPAAKAGIETGDFLIEVEGFIADNFTVNEIVAKIKGEVKEINLVIEVDGKQIEKQFETALVEIPSVSSKIIETDGKKTGYIFISLFAENTDEQFKAELKEMETTGIDNLIIDLRDNSGGHLSSTKNIADFFLNKDQVIYQIESKTGITKTYATNKEVRDIEIVVLVNGNSASGSVKSSGADDCWFNVAYKIL